MPLSHKLTVLHQLTEANQSGNLPLCPIKVAKSQTSHTSALCEHASNPPKSDRDPPNLRPFEVIKQNSGLLPVCNYPTR